LAGRVPGDGELEEVAFALEEKTAAHAIGADEEIEGRAAFGSVQAVSVDAVGVAGRGGEARRWNGFDAAARLRHRGARVGVGDRGVAAAAGRVADEEGGGEEQHQRTNGLGKRSKTAWCFAANSG